MTSACLGMQIYEMCLNDFGPAHHWMAFLDAG